MEYNVKDLRLLVNKEGSVLPFTISKKGDKIKNVLTQKVISLKQNIEADIIEQEDLSDYKMYHEVFCAKSSAALSKTLGYDVKVLQTETAITGSFTGLKNQNPWEIFDGKVDEKGLKNLVQRINVVNARYAKKELEK